LFNSFLYIKVIRKLSFSKPSRNYYEIKDDVINVADIDDEYDDDDNKVRILIFKYIKERDYNNALLTIKTM
jgi:hypothetical protein